VSGELPAGSTGRSYAARAGAALVAVLVGVGVCELAARILTPRPPDRTRQPPLSYLYDPEIKYILAPNQQGWIDEGLVTVNSLGFRGRETASPKPAGRFRVVAIGDSVTIGMSVNDDETFAAQLEAQLHARFPARDLDVVNLGVAGYDTRQEVGLLERNLTRLSPDLVLVGFYTNDVPDALQTEAAPAGTTIAAANATPGQVLHMDSTSPSFVDKYLRRIRLVYLAGRTFNRWRGAGEAGMARLALEVQLLQGQDSSDLERAWSIVTEQFRRLHALATAHHFAVAIVALPPRELVTGQYESAAYVNRLRALVTPFGFDVIDPVPAMRDSGIRGDRLYVPYDRNHPNAAGHRLIARAIFNRVERSLADGQRSRVEGARLRTEKVRSMRLTFPS